VILCLCEGLSDETLRAEVRAGATEVRELVRRTGAGSHCGSCVCDLRCLVEACRPRPDEVQDDEQLPLAAK